MIKAENRGKRVRGVIAIGNDSCCYITTDPREAEKHNCIIAYTHWYRHDENLRELENDLETLKRAYSQMAQTTSMLIHYEYKDYKK